MATARKQTAAVAVLAIAIEKESNKIRKRRRFWCKSWLQRRDQYSDMRLLRELQENNPNDFKNYLRMDETAISELLTAVTLCDAPCNIAQGTTDGNAQVPGNRKTTRGFVILYWDITSCWGKSYQKHAQRYFTHREGSI
jgi:uncharacterized Fe-S radical SAM superfamily protein PflX